MEFNSLKTEADVMLEGTQILAASCRKLVFVDLGQLAALTISRRTFMYPMRSHKREATYLLS